MLIYCLDRYTTQEMCHKTIDAYLSAWNFVSEWFVMKTWELDNVMLSNDDIEHDDIDTDTVTFFSDNMENVEDETFDEDDPPNIVRVILAALHNRFKQRKSCKDSSVGLVYEKI